MEGVLGIGTCVAHSILGVSEPQVRLFCRVLGIGIDV